MSLVFPSDSSEYESRKVSRSQRLSSALEKLDVSPSEVWTHDPSERESEAKSGGSTAIVTDHSLSASPKRRRVRKEPAHLSHHYGHRKVISQSNNSAAASAAASSSPSRRIRRSPQPTNPMSEGMAAPKPPKFDESGSPIPLLSDKSGTSGRSARSILLRRSQKTDGSSNEDEIDIRVRKERHTSLDSRSKDSDPFLDRLLHSSVRAAGVSLDSGSKDSPPLASTMTTLRSAEGESAVVPPHRHHNAAESSVSLMRLSSQPLSVSAETHHEFEEGRASDLVDARTSRRLGEQSVTSSTISTSSSQRVASNSSHSTRSLIGSPKNGRALPMVSERRQSSKDDDRSSALLNNPQMRSSSNRTRIQRRSPEPRSSRTGLTTSKLYPSHRDHHHHPHHHHRRGYQTRIIDGDASMVKDDSPMAMSLPMDLRDISDSAHTRHRRRIDHHSRHSSAISTDIRTLQSSASAASSSSLQSSSAVEDAPKRMNDDSLVRPTLAVEKSAVLQNSDDSSDSSLDGWSNPRSIVTVPLQRTKRIRRVSPLKRRDGSEFGSTDPSPRSVASIAVGIAADDSSTSPTTLQRMSKIDLSPPYRRRRVAKRGGRGYKRIPSASDRTPTVTDHEFGAGYGSGIRVNQSGYSADGLSGMSSAMDTDRDLPLKNAAVPVAGGSRVRRAASAAAAATVAVAASSSSSLTNDSKSKDDKPPFKDDILRKRRQRGRMMMAGSEASDASDAKLIGTGVGSSFLLTSATGNQSSYSSTTTMTANSFRSKPPLTSVIERYAEIERQKRSQRDSQSSHTSSDDLSRGGSTTHFSGASKRIRTIGDSDTSLRTGAVLSPIRMDKRSKVKKIRKKKGRLRKGDDDGDHKSGVDSENEVSSEEDGSSHDDSSSTETITFKHPSESPTHRSKLMKKGNHIDDNGKPQHHHSRSYYESWSTLSRRSDRNLGVVPVPRPAMSPLRRMSPEHLKYYPYHRKSKSSGPTWSSSKRIKNDDRKELSLSPLAPSLQTSPLPSRGKQSSSFSSVHTLANDLSVSSLDSPPFRKKTGDSTLVVRSKKKKKKLRRYPRIDTEKRPVKKTSKKHHPHRHHQSAKKKDDRALLMDSRMIETNTMTRTHTQSTFTVSDLTEVTVGNAHESLDWSADDHHRHPRDPSSSSVRTIRKISKRWREQSMHSDHRPRRDSSTLKNNDDREKDHVHSIEETTKKKDENQIRRVNRDLYRQRHQRGVSSDYNHHHHPSAPVSISSLSVDPSLAFDRSLRRRKITQPKKHCDEKSELSTSEMSVNQTPQPADRNDVRKVNELRIRVNHQSHLGPSLVRSNLSEQEPLALMNDHRRHTHPSVLNDDFINDDEHLELKTTEDLTGSDEDLLFNDGQFSEQCDSSAPPSIHAGRWTDSPPSPKSAERQRMDEQITQTLSKVFSLLVCTSLSSAVQCCCVAWLLVARYLDDGGVFDGSPLWSVVLVSAIVITQMVLVLFDWSGYIRGWIAATQLPFEKRDQIHWSLRVTLLRFALIRGLRWTGLSLTSLICWLIHCWFMRTAIVVIAQAGVAALCGIVVLCCVAANRDVFLAVKQPTLKQTEQC